MKNAILTLRNALDYPLRQLFKWQRAIPTAENESKENLYSHLKPEHREQADALAQRLCEEYHLGRFFASSKADNYRENLYYLEMIENALDYAKADLPDMIDVVDIGVSHWFYVQALHAALKWWGSNQGRGIALWGYEIDPYRVYSDFHSRADHARSHIAQLKHTQFVPQAFEEQPGRFDLVIQFFPFVFVKDHLEWGLPKSIFDHKKILRVAWNSLAAQGYLLIVNQGAEEHHRQIELLQDLGIQPIANFEHKSQLYQYPHPRFVLVAAKSPDDE